VSAFIGPTGDASSATRHQDITVPLYLLRHGETAFNVAGRYQGHNDSALTETGKQQARANGLILAGLIDDFSDVQFASSPLGRALETSRLICGVLGKDFSSVSSDERLKEMNYGAWQGLTVAEIEQEFPGQWEYRMKDPANYTMPGGGESYDDLFARVDGWMRDTAEYWDNGGTLVAISHGGTGSVIRGIYLGLDAHQVRALDRPHDQLYEIGDGQVISHGPGISE
jgi:broad specificity phosphatase PhoE